MVDKLIANPKHLSGVPIAIPVILILGLGIIGAGTTLLLQQRNTTLPAIVTEVIAVVTKVIDRDTTQTAVVTRVIDDDTIEIEGGQRVRYIGIDTPEKGEYFFEEATAKNSELVLGKEIRLEKDVSETDQYDRLLRYVYIGDLFINAELVRLGYAREALYPPDTMHSEEFYRLEKYALASDLGLHNEPEPEPEPTYVPTYTPKLFEEPESDVPTYKANDVIELAKQSSSLYAEAEETKSWAIPRVRDLRCTTEYLGNSIWRIEITGVRENQGVRETLYFNESKGRLSKYRFG